MQNSQPTELSIYDLQDVTGGQGLTLGGGLRRGFVDSLKSLYRTPNQSDGHVVNHMRGWLPETANNKPRGWLGGNSINSLTRDMRHNSMKGAPLYPWSVLPSSPR